MADNIEVLLELRELRGRVDTFIQTLSTSNEQSVSQASRLNSCENRLTALEATNKTVAAGPTVLGVVGALTPILALALVVFDKLYGG